MSKQDQIQEKLNRDILTIQSKFKKIALKLDNGALSKIEVGSPKQLMIGPWLNSGHEIDFNGENWKSLSYQEKQEILFIRSFSHSFIELLQLLDQGKSFEKVFTTINNSLTQSIHQLRQDRGIITTILDTLADCLNTLIGLFTPRYTPGLFGTSDQLLQDGKLLISKFGDTVEKTIQNLENLDLEETSPSFS